MNPFLNFLKNSVGFNGIGGVGSGFGISPTSNGQLGFGFSSKPLPNNQASTTTNSPAATSAAPTVNTPASSPAKSNYISSLSNTPDQASNLQSQIKDLQGTLTSAQNAGYGANDQIQYNSSGILPKNSNPGSTPPSNPAEDPLSAYATYLKGYQDTANTANTKLADIQNKEDQANVSARRQYQETLDTSGLLKGGAQQAASVVDRRNNQNLADLALQESAAARSASIAQNALGNAKPLQIGNNYYDPGTGKLLTSTNSSNDTGFTLGTGQVRYQKDPATGEYKAVGNNNAAADDTTDLGQQLVNGMIDPSQLSKRTTNYNAVLKAANDYSMQTTGKPYDIAKATRDYKYATNIGTINTLNYLGSLVGGEGKTGNLDELVNTSNAISRTSFPALNDAAAWGRLATGDPNIAAYYATVTEVADQIAKILQGGGTGAGTSDAKLTQAAGLFQSGFSKEQINSTVQALRPLLQNRAKNLIGNNPYLSDYATQFGVDNGSTNTQTSSTNSGSSAPLTVKAADGNTYGFHQDANGNWVAN